jgi:ATP-dependent Clp endopeptidase proteolytic subunit ClpP
MFQSNMSASGKRKTPSKKQFSTLYQRESNYPTQRFFTNKKIKKSPSTKHDIKEDLRHLFEDADEENGLSASSSDVYSKDNHIYYKSDVNKRSVEQLIDLLDEKNEEYEEIKLDKLIKNYEPEPIYLHITSFGGSLFMGMKAVDAIKRSKVPVHTIVDGYAASCGSLMAVVGVKRYMTPRSYQLIHQLSSGMWGKYSELKDEMENCETLMDTIRDIYVDNTSMEKDSIDSQLKHDSWWNADKCLEVGLIDQMWK